VTFTVREFSDLLSILNDQPEWRRRLQRALYPDFDPEAGFRDLAEAIKRLTAMQERFDREQTGVTQDVSVLKQDVSVLKQDVSVLKQDVSVLKQDVSVLKQDVSVLKQDVSIIKNDIKGLRKDNRDFKGRMLEQSYRNAATGLFGVVIRKGHDAKPEITDPLYDAQRAGIITQQERQQVLAADLIWGGDELESRRPALLVMEASWLVEDNDIERAVQRSMLLQRIGLPALPVVGGKEWTESAAQAARAQGVVIVNDHQLEDASWQMAWGKWQI
jgi:cell division protein FtsB